MGSPQVISGHTVKSSCFIVERYRVVQLSGKGTIRVLNGTGAICGK